MFRILRRRRATARPLFGKSLCPKGTHPMNAHTGTTTRREWMRNAIGLSGLILSSGRGAWPRKASRPNILWITCEDMSCHLGCYGDVYARTPHLDQLARESIRYTNAYATAPVCSPTRSCLITGCYATSLGTQNLRSQFPIPDDIHGFPSYLRDRGYYCTNNVKTDYNIADEPTLVQQAWDECSPTAHWKNRKEGQPFFAIFNDMTTHQSRMNVWPEEQFKTEVQSELSESERHDPALAPVPPYYPDTPVIRKTLARAYDCISVMDKHVGARLKELEEAGLAEDTIVFFYGDHGAGLPRHKRLLLDSGLRAPLIVRFPKNDQHLAPARPGSVSDELVSFVDLPPTVLRLLDLPIPEYMRGRPLYGDGAPGPRTYVFGARDRVDEAYDLARSVRDKNWLYVRNYMPHLSYNQPSAYSDQGEIRQEITRLAQEGKLTTTAQRHYAGPTRALEELYDTANDPHQINNLAQAPECQAIKEKLKSRLRKWMIETWDLGFIPECDVAERMGDGTPYERLRDEARYPIREVLEAAERVGAGRAVLRDQIELLADHKDAAVRYWAAVGLHAQADAAEPAVPTLIQALDDPGAAVRIEAAATLMDLGKSDRALPLLLRELQHPDTRVSLRAARALELLEDKAGAAMITMKQVLEKNKQLPGDGPMFMVFSLEAALKKLNKNPGDR